MFLKEVIAGQLAQTAGPWSSILKSQPLPLQYLWSAEVGADLPELAGGSGEQQPEHLRRN